ncbi:MAG TPA: NAD(P)-dependent oxidoreductase [Candidatus Limnocylindrales bacterium]|nr:NAD(P)-dependent oxidoreductase [Candidatus Limnocylindrales bacterium]
MHKVLVVGSKGVIGSILQKHLPYEITDFDLPEYNAQNYHHLYEKAKGHDTLVHLAWDFQSDGWLAENLNPNNTKISFNVYQAAVDAGVKRVIVASSVHADKFAGRDASIEGLLQPYDLPTPDSPYGAGKVFLEALGKYYSDAKGLEVICIRFGGVNKNDTPPESPYSERQVWLSQKDCVSLVQSCIDASSIPNGYAIVYGVSNNKDMLHDISNPFGWEPSNGAR